MYGSLFWIEWLDRLDRVVTGTRQDVAALNRAITPRSLAALERSRRQLVALNNDLRLLDRDVLPTDGLQTALDAALIRLANFGDIQTQTEPAIRDRALAAIDSALRDSRYQAKVLLEPGPRRTSPAASAPLGAAG